MTGTSVPAKAIMHIERRAGTISHFYIMCAKATDVVSRNPPARDTKGVAQPRKRAAMAVQKHRPIRFKCLAASAWMSPQAPRR